ncbi:FkbM family methyltransferase [Candidatus Kaiserbacteria bacterium]|nr:FkbM family methyltransferase [Candidatus Kaiserbacteria bacterium]
MDPQNIQNIRTRYGAFFIDVVRDKKMAYALKSAAYPSEGLLRLARLFVNEKSVVVDIGAHIGTFAVPIAAHAGRVIAFEPSPASFELLSRNVGAANGNFELKQEALGKESGSGTILVRNASNAGANTLSPGDDIPVATLDSEVAHADFIKIDVEGMELDVLRGGAGLIERARPAVLFEVNLFQLRAHGTSPRALERFFKTRKYSLYFPLAGKLACVANTTLVSALFAPRAWLFGSDSAPFDLLAVPRERPLPVPCGGFFRLIRYLISENLTAKLTRLSRIFSHASRRYTGHTA